MTRTIDQIIEEYRKEAVRERLDAGTVEDYEYIPDMNRENAELIIEEYYEMAAEHEQIADWLEELTRLRIDRCSTVEQIKAYEQGKADATKWIPCKEKLPEKGKYLICTELGTITTLTYEEGWNCYKGYGDQIVRDNEITDIVAWMELPERYQNE